MLNMNKYFTLKTKLILSSLIAITGFFWLGFLIITSVNKTTNLNVILQNIERINSNVFSLINIQKDFIHKKELKYSSLFSKESHSIRLELKKVEETLKQYDIDSKDIFTYKKLLNNYKKSFFNLVITQKKIGFNGDEGIHYNLKLPVLYLEKYLIKIHEHDMITVLFKLKKDARDFIATKRMKYVKSFNENIKSLLKNPSLTNIEHQNNLQMYQNNFLKLVKYQKIIGLNEKSGLLEKIQKNLLLINKQSEYLRDTLIAEIKKEILDIKNITYLSSAVVTILVIALLIFIINIILGPLTKLRNQYKDAIDTCTIVSKTTPEGIITYVNDEFCKISGYKRSELIGRNQNIVKHPDTSKDVFIDMWKTIKKHKRTWSGNIKNLRKGGSSYWVKTIIKPILNDKDEVIEYISMRTDISEHEDMKNYFKELLYDESKNHIDTMNKAKEYRAALNKSNIISVFNLNYEFTYVNKAYCELTGYSKEELLGKSIKVIMGLDNHKELFKKVEKILISGKSWKGIVKNQTKNNKDYWTNVIYIPIKNENKKIVEYMGIRTDVTELFTLHNEVEETQREIIYKMGEVGESRSEETGNHVKRVAEYSKSLALLSGLSEKEANNLLTASPMHDIGKVGIPDSILKKPGKLTFEEFEVMKTHVNIGFNILKGSKREVLQAAAIVAYEHHEKYDGSGYPRGLKGEDIHIYGRITAIADVFDALGSERVYKKAWKDEDIFALFEEQKAKHFDPKLIELFIKNIDVFIKIRDKYVD